MSNENYQENTWSFNNVDVDGGMASVDFTADSWPEVLGRFLMFLRGCGFEGLNNNSIAINQQQHPNLEWEGQWFLPDN